MSVEPIPAGEATGVGAAADVPSDDAGRRGGEPGEGVAMGGREDCTEVGELPGQAGSEGALSSLEAASVGDCPDQPLLRTPFHVDGRWGGAVEGETGSREGVGRGVREGERGGRQLPAVVGPAVVGSQTSASLGADPLGGWKRLRGVGAGEVLLEVGLPVAMCTMGVVTGLITLYVTIALPAV